eukprot:gene7912-8767_t
MEFPALGKQCSVEFCQQLDFLPFSCDACSKVFCVNHKERSSHQCPESQSNKNFGSNDKTLSESFKCELHGCSGAELVRVNCSDCHKNFCLRHRHQQDHNCEKYSQKQGEQLTPKEKVEAVIGRELNTELKVKESKNARAAKTAAKVTLMKLKMHAIGDKSIPQVDRIYFNVELPTESSGKATTPVGCPMFFSKTWSAGRIIDNVAAMKNIKNENNIADAKKLRLFSDGVALDSAANLQSLIESGDINLDSQRLLKLCYTDTEYHT